MKTLVLIRHAKSSWKDDSLTDFERPLNKRGERDAPRMAERLAARGALPQRIVSSPALRAWTTAQVFARACGYAEDAILRKERVYEASMEALLEIIRELSDADESVFLVGHNPGITLLVNDLTGHRIDNVPTCGVAELGLRDPRWRDVAAGRAQLLDFDYPKRISGPESGSREPEA